MIKLIYLLWPRQPMAPADRRITRVVWTPPARPFFGAGEAIADDSGALFWRPQGDSNP